MEPVLQNPKKFIRNIFIILYNYILKFLIAASVWSGGFFALGGLVGALATGFAVLGFGAVGAALTTSAGVLFVALALVGSLKANVAGFLIVYKVV